CPGGAHRGHDHSPLPALRVHLHGPPEYPSQSALPRGHRLRHHRGRRGHHDREHRPPSLGAQAPGTPGGPGSPARRGGRGAPPLLPLTLIPVLSSSLFRRPPSERESPLLALLRRPYRPAIRWCVRRPLLPILGAVALLVVSLWTFSLLGKEFLPELDEGDLWVRMQFPVGVSLEGVRPYVREIRERLLRFPQVRVVVSQLGAPDDGTDPEAPDNSEFYVGLKPREEWPAHDRDKEKLIQNMTAALADIPG